jgi:YD repeat-containing protein
VTMIYDNNGNRTSPNGDGSYASNHLNQYTKFNGIVPGYDNNGNVKEYDGWTYEYDAQNRLKAVKHGATIVEQFWYDGLNRIITKNLNGNVTYHVYDAWNLIEEYAGPFSPPPPPPSPTPAPSPTPTATATATASATATATATATPTARRKSTAASRARGMPVARSFTRDEARELNDKILPCGRCSGGAQSPPPNAPTERGDYSAFV